MKTINTGRLMVLMALCLLCHSCGVITKTRYGNGFKLNIGENWGHNKTEQESSKSEKKQVKLSSIQKTEPPLLNIEDQTFNTVTLPSNKILQQSIPLESKAKPSIKTEESGQLKLYPQNGIIEERPPMEPNAKWSGRLFYGGYILFIIAALLESEVLLAVLSTLYPILSVIALVLAIVALGNIKRSGYYYRGRGLALSVVVIWIISLIFTLFIMLLLFAIFI